MQRLPSINPGDTSKYANGIGTFDIGAADEGSKILLKNFSPLNLDLDFLNGSTDMLHAWEANYWTLDGDTPQIEWEVDADSLNVSAPPISAVFMTLYAPQEKISGTYPVYFGLQTSIGNQGGLPSSVSSLQNTGNPAGANVVSVGSTGAAGTTWTASNDGLWTLAVTIAAALVQVLKTNETDPILQLGALTHLVEVLGNFQADQDITALHNIWGQGLGESTNFTQAIDLSAHNGNANFLHAIFVAGNIAANGVGTGLSVAHNQTIGGNLALSGTLNLGVGSLTKWNVFNGTANNAGTLQAHGLGVLPDFCMFQELQASGDTNTFSWDKAASDATNVKVWTLNATPRNYIALAIKL